MGIISGLAIAACIGGAWNIWSAYSESKSIDKLRETEDAEKDAFIQQIENRIRNYKII